MRAGMRWQRGITACVAMAFAAGLVHAETCGIDSLFAHGFEVPAPGGDIDSTPGALHSPGIAQSIVGPPTFSVAITYPAPNATVSGLSTAVAGTISGPTNTGVVVNGVRAYVLGNQFLAAAVSVEAFGTALTATATKLTGETATATVNASGGAAPPVALIVGRAGGFAPLRAVFTYSIGTLPGNATIQYVGLDYTADGTDDVVNPPLGASLAYVANQPGVYHARLTVKDSNNATYTADAYYAARSAPELGGMLCDVYGYMKQRLGQPTPDIPGALDAIHPNARDEYEGMFYAGSSSLPAYVANLGSIVAGVVTDDFGSYLVVRENPDQTLSGYHLEFSQDATGVWRISDM